MRLEDGPRPLQGDDAALRVAARPHLMDERGDEGHEPAHGDQEEAQKRPDGREGGAALRTPSAGRLANERHHVRPEVIFLHRKWTFLKISLESIFEKFLSEIIFRLWRASEASAQPDRHVKRQLVRGISLKVRCQI